MTEINKLFKDNAIGLFAQSQCAKSGLGLQVLQQLRSLPDSRFEYIPLPWNKHAVTGRQLHGPLGISVADRYKGNLQMTSLQFAHEGVHVLKWSESVVEQELHAYRLMSQYYTELRNGLRWGQVVHSIPADSENDEAVKRVNNGKLVDWLVQEYPKEITGQWVMGHITYWGGIKNRNPATKARYLSAIADSNLYSTAALDVILQLLKSIAISDVPKGYKLPLNRQSYFHMLWSRYADPTRKSLLAKECKRLFNIDLQSLQH